MIIANPGPTLTEYEYSCLDEIIHGLDAGNARAAHGEFMATLSAYEDMKFLFEHLQRLQPPAKNVQIRLHPGHRTVIEQICRDRQFRDEHTFRSSGQPNLKSILMRAALEMRPNEVFWRQGSGASDSPMHLDMTPRQLIKIWTNAALSDPAFTDGTGRVPLGPYTVCATLFFGQKSGVYALHGT